MQQREIRWLLSSIAALLLGLSFAPHGARAADAPNGSTDASNARFRLEEGINNEPVLYIYGTDSVVTLPDIRAALASPEMISSTISLTATADMLVEEPDKVWSLNISLFLGRDATLQLTDDTVTWLKLRSQDGDIRTLPQTTQQAPTAINYNSFATIRTYNGNIVIDGAQITSWDPSTKTYDTNIKNGRSYLLAKYDSRMDITNADMSYLGYSDTESYGVSWRDSSEDLPGVLLTRVTGVVENSTFSHNYYGIYTFQASNMVFRGNTFRNNVSYGFDPHDYSNNFLVENNEAYENGNHGFIISRGCYDFIIRNNKSYNNRYTVGDEDRLAHGFMLDPGSPNSEDPQVPSSNNLLENNQAYNNEGYGIRMINALSNTLRLNTFANNVAGITLEEGSTGNIIEQNTVTNSALHGIYAFGGSDNTTITGNTVSNSGRNGIYVKTGYNTITGNIVTDNGTVEGAALDGAGIATLRETDIAAARADLRLPGTERSLADDDPTLVSAPTQISDITQNVIAQNTVARSADDGIELKGAVYTQVLSNTVLQSGLHGIYLTDGTSETLVEQNTVYANGGHGIRANGEDSVGNTWVENSVYDNVDGGITTTSDANRDIKPPDLVRLGDTVRGETLPGAVVELYSDDAGQGRFFEARLVADAEGAFSITRAWQGAMVNATVTDQDGNSSDLGLVFRLEQTRTYLPIVGR